MENLQNTITKTDTLKNNLKTVTNQIKQSIVRGGGSDFKSLAETPKRIESLIKEYNKVATINTAQIIPQEGWIQIPTGTSFLPKYAFVSILASDNVYPNKLWWDTRENLEIISRDSGRIEIGLSSAFFTKDFIKFYKESRSTTKFKIENITFIG